MPRPAPVEDPDAGFTLVEVLVSLAVITVVLTSVSTFLVRSMVMTNLEGVRQAATQVASTAMEELRSVPGNQAPTWLTANAAMATVPVGTHTYTRTWTGDWNTPGSVLIAATVHVTWTSRDCPSNLCEYSDTTLISTVGAEPTFDLAGP